MDVSEYEAQADLVDVNDIATNSNNRNVLRRIKRNEDDNNELLRIQNQHDDYWDEDDEDCTDYVPEGAGDMGWLGYFVGKNHHLHDLHIRPFTPTSGSSVRDEMEPFWRGVGSNKSIRAIEFDDANLMGGEVFTMMTQFFQYNNNLIDINIHNCDFGDEGCRLFALALGSSTNKSLKMVQLEDNNISEEGMVDIITSLSVFPNLEFLDVGGNHLRKNGCVALATLVQISSTELQDLYIIDNEINDDGIEALIPALTNCNRLQFLNLSNNPSITTTGWQSLATILESPNSNLEELHIARNNIDDQAAAVFVHALANNHGLHGIYLDNNPSITAKGWQAFTKVLCDTSSVNATFLSNHTLRYLGHEIDGNEIIGPLLRLNRRLDKKEVAIIKILQNHTDFDMLPFFEWEFKVLPLALHWLERASEYDMPENFEPNIEGRKLSTIYQFVRGMPVLYVETRLRKELEDIKAEQSQMEEKFGEEQRRLLQEQQRLLKEFKQRKQYLHERRQSIMKNLGVGGNLQS